MTNNISLELCTQPKSDKQHKATYVHTKGLTRKNDINRSNRRKERRPDALLVTLMLNIQVTI